MDDVKLKIERSELILHKIISEDTFSDLINKLNNNFDIIKEYGGGRPGIKGDQGYNICTGSGGSEIDTDTDNIVNEFITTDEAVAGCLDTDYNIDISNIANSYYIINKYAGKSLIFSNLYEDDFNTYSLAKFDSEEIASQKVSTNNHDSKLKIYNSDEFGAGKHIHLLNTKNILTDEQYFCKSGVSMSVDKDDNTNTEYFRVRGELNSDIENHRQVTELISNYVTLKRNDKSQEFKLDPGLPDDSNYSGRLQLQKQNANNTFRLSDRTGWLGIWQDTTSDKEIWEEFLNDNLVIQKLRYSLNGSVLTASELEPKPLILSDDTYVRFKRLNNFVLIDFRLAFEKSSNIIFKNSIVRLNIETVKCRTSIWNTGSVYCEDFDFSDKLHDNYNYKIESADVPGDGSFSIYLKSNSGDNIEFNNNQTKIYFTGQIFATLDDPNLYCEPLIILDDDACENLEII